jgi:glycerol kinase
MGIRGEVFSTKTSTGKRTYFFNIKENRHGDLFLNMVESKKQMDSSFERHSMIVFEEDLDTFMDGLNQAVEFLRKDKKSRPDAPAPQQP